MIKIYALIIIVAVLGSVGYGAKSYYKETQDRITTLQKNNAKLETALETSQASIESLQQDVQKFSALNQKLQVELQKAEAYGDELRGKLSRINLVQEALRDAEKLEGKMNGASADLWRGIMEDTGGSGDAPLPNWLQPDVEAGAGDQSSN
tara:strand:- start:294 stop:743 length:450 start_codon:yes stop_codon:yes gene_type:complete